MQVLRHLGNSPTWLRDSTIDNALHVHVHDKISFWNGHMQWTIGNKAMHWGNGQ